MDFPPSNNAFYIITQRFGSNFWDDHAGRLIKEPRIAIVELVANSWDAGARKVHITYPAQDGEIFEIIDDGIGMTVNEFEQRWSELNYNRIEGGQGEDVVFPIYSNDHKRKAYGRNGKGRHSMFCFTFEYWVETWRNGNGNRYKVSKESGKHPFLIVLESSFERAGSGTIVFGQMIHNRLDIDEVRSLIGSKFVADPSFNIYLNNELIQLGDLQELIESEVTIDIKPYGNITILLINSQTYGRISQHHGVAWWVNKRVVGIPSWEGFEVGKYIDRRKSEARQYTFVVLADIMHDQVLADWTGFSDSDKTKSVVSQVNEIIQGKINELFSEVRREIKKKILSEHSEEIRELTKTARKRIGEFIDTLQQTQPTIADKHLSSAVGALANIEKSRLGYKLLDQLAELSPSDIDSLSELLSKWSVTEMEIILDELERRLRLIKQLEAVVETKSDELHQIHPLFESGLWIFGPEYETIEFTSNRQLATVIKNLLHDNPDILSTPRKRPDLVILPDESILRIFAQDQYDDNNGEVIGIEKVLIIELKKGSAQISQTEMIQALHYAKEISRSGKVSKSTRIQCFVLGTTISDDSQEAIIQGNIQVTPMPYSTILRKAHNRTLKLIDKIEAVTGKVLFDEEINYVLSQSKEDND